MTDTNLATNQENFFKIYFEPFDDTTSVCKAITIVKRLYNVHNYDVDLIVKCIKKLVKNDISDLSIKSNSLV